MLSDSPPERDLPWSEAGIEGAWPVSYTHLDVYKRQLPTAPGDVIQRDGQRMEHPQPKGLAVFRP